MVVTLTTEAKNWLAINAGVSNCFAPTGVVYKDADGISHTGATGDIVNAFLVAHMVGLDSAEIIASTNYTVFKTINGGNDIGFDDVNFAYNNDGAVSGTPAYCYVAPPVLTTITISPASASIQIGATQQLSVTCSDQYGAAFTCPILTWSSSDPYVATVGASGLVTGIAEGSASITANSSGITSNASVVTVTLPPPPVLTKITISPVSTSIQIGTTKQLTAICSDQYGKNMTCPTLTWSSSSPSVATVDASGLVTGIAEGSSSITATASGVTSDASVMMVIISPPAESGMGGIIVVGLAFGAILMFEKGRKKKL